MSAAADTVPKIGSAGFAVTLIPLGSWICKYFHIFHIKLIWFRISAVSLEAEDTQQTFDRSNIQHRQRWTAKQTAKLHFLWNISVSCLHKHRLDCAASARTFSQPKAGKFLVSHVKQHETEMKRCLWLSWKTLRGNVNYGNQRVSIDGKCWIKLNCLGRKRQERARLLVSSAVIFTFLPKEEKRKPFRLRSQTLNYENCVCSTNSYPLLSSPFCPRDDDTPTRNLRGEEKLRKKPQISGHNGNRYTKFRLCFVIQPRHHNKLMDFSGSLIIIIDWFASHLEFAFTIITLWWRRVLII